jgi:hypothetical protein
MMMIVAMLLFVGSMGAEPLLILSSQLDQLQQAAYAPSEKAKELQFKDQGSFLGNSEVFSDWAGRVAQYVRTLQDSVFRKSELISILSAAKDTTKLVVQQALKALSEAPKKSIDVNVPFSEAVLTSLTELEKLCGESDMGESCSWITSQKVMLAQAVKPKQEETSRVMNEQVITQKFREWRDISDKWNAQKNVAGLMIAGAKFDPDTITVQQQEAILQACSWKGLATMLGVPVSADMQQQVMAKLVEARVSDEANVYDAVDDIIINNIKMIVVSLKEFYDHKTVSAEGAKIIEHVNEWNNFKIKQLLGQIAQLCQSKIPDVRKKYEKLKSFFEKYGIWKEYPGIVTDAWCTVIEQTALVAYKQLLQEMVKKIPDKIVNSAQWNSYVKVAKVSFKSDWEDWEAGCSLDEKFDISDVLNRAKEARES